MVLTKKWGILIKEESESLDFSGLKIPRDYKMKMEVIYINLMKENIHRIVTCPMRDIAIL